MLLSGIVSRSTGLLVHVHVQLMCCVETQPPSPRSFLLLISLVSVWSCAFSRLSFTADTPLNPTLLLVSPTTQQQQQHTSQQQQQLPAGHKHAQIATASVHPLLTP